MVYINLSELYNSENYIVTTTGKTLIMLIKKNEMPATFLSMIFMNYVCLSNK